MNTIDRILGHGEVLCENQRPLGLPEVRAYLIQKQRGIASLLFGLGKIVFVEGKVIETAANDGLHTYININMWRKLSVEEAAFLLAHELLHQISLHPERMSKLLALGFDGNAFDPPTFNDAADYVINDILEFAKCGTMPAGEYEGLHDINIGTRHDAVEEVYRKMMQKQQQNGQPKSNPGKGGGIGSGMPAAGTFDQLLPIDPDAPSQATVDRQIATAMAAEKSQGDGGAGFLRMFEKLLEPEVDWRFLLRQAFHTARGRNRSTWRKLNRRYLPRGVLMPGRDGTTLGTIVVAFDTSGSVGIHETEAYLAECVSILEEVRPKKLWAVPCDAQVYEPVAMKEPRELKEFAKTKMRGGGGTSFVPVFNWVIEKNINPEVLVFCTDMFGSFPSGPPRYPVIWVSTGGTHAPFGQVIKLDKV